MTKHTPGPWHVTSGLNEGYITSDTHGFVPIRTPFREDAFKDGPCRSDYSEEELRANATFIAAAPDMHQTLIEELEALKTWRAWQALPPDIEEGIGISIDKIERVLRKARGQK